MIRYKYNRMLAPPAPFVNVTVKNLATGARVENYPGQIDPWADRTVLPEVLVKALELPQTDVMRIGGLGGFARDLPHSSCRFPFTCFQATTSRSSPLPAKNGQFWAAMF